MNDHRIITVAQMRAIDAASSRLGVSVSTLMEAAGKAVAGVALMRMPLEVMCPHSDTEATSDRDDSDDRNDGGLARPERPQMLFDVLCGPGDNGGDGYVAARILRDKGIDVQVLALGVPKNGTAAAAARAAWGDGIKDADVAHLREGAVVIDALFGAGLSRPLDGVAAELALACANRTVMSVDVPSGLPGDGAAPKGACFRADETVTFACKKPAHVLMPGLDLCGAVFVEDIGVPAVAFDGLTQYAQENDVTLWDLPIVPRDAHKHQRGRVCVVAGPPGVSLTFGAQRLAASAALRVGAGWVTAAIERPADALFFATPMALMCTPRAALDLSLYQALVFGSGLKADAETDALCLEVCALRVPIVLDGGAISPTGVSVLPPGSVVTPHAGEFARAFLECSQGNKIDRTRAAAKSCNAVVVFKGPDTVIAAPDGRVRVNTTGLAALATAGTGDVLAGVIAGLIGQGMDAFDAASAGVWLHGDAALRVGGGLIADDLVSALQPAAASLQSAQVLKRDSAMPDAHRRVRRRRRSRILNGSPD